MRCKQRLHIHAQNVTISHTSKHSNRLTTITERQLHPDAAFGSAAPAQHCSNSLETHTRLCKEHTGTASNQWRQAALTHTRLRSKCFSAVSGDKSWYLFFVGGLKLKGRRKAPEAGSAAPQTSKDTMWPNTSRIRGNAALSATKSAWNWRKAKWFSC